MVRQAQLDMAKLFMLLMVLVARLGSVEGLLLQLPTMLQGLWAEQFDTFQRSVMGSIQDTIRSVLRTEIQERQPALLPNVVYERSRHMPECLPETGSSSGVVKLRFVDADRPNDPIYTGSPVQWQNGQNAKVAIFRDGNQIMGGDLSKLQIEILPVHADLFTERGEDDFTEEEFNKQIHMCKGKESVLTTVSLRNGEAYLGSIKFTECSQRKKLRLIARVKRQDLTARVQKAITDPFVVKVHRSELNAKSCLPSKVDAVHRLKNISQKGKRCSVLAAKNITTVKDLMRQYHKDKSGLQKLTGMKRENWSTMIEHASTCDPGDEIYSYRVAEENCELLFNDFYDLVGMIINGQYVPVRNLDQFQQRKVNNWKKSAYKKFEDRENSGGLIPDYLMSHDHPARAVPLNSEAGPSVQAGPIWQYPNDMAAQQEFGEQHPLRQHSGFSPAEVLSNKDAGPSKQEAPLFSQHTVHQDLGQHGPSMPQNGTLYCHNLGNIVNGQGSLSAQPTIPSYNLPPVQEDDSDTGACVTSQRNSYLSSSIADAPGTSFPVADGVHLPTSSLNNVHTDDFSWLPLIEELFESEAHIADQGFVPATNAEPPNSNYQFDGNEHDGGNR
uniref:Uncharacterized protein n=1 Tax=Avena sativa TaxID=4498 RepID=A0ACD5X9B6_AVESA